MDYLWRMEMLFFVIFKVYLKQNFKKYIFFLFWFEWGKVGTPVKFQVLVCKED